MPDKLTDEQIKKALDEAELFLRNRVMDGQALKLNEYDVGILRNISQVCAKAYDEINRLQAENKKFKDRQKPTGASGYKIENGKVVFFTNMLGGYREEKENLEEVVKTLNELLQECYSKDEIAFALKCKTEELKTAKAEAYKECMEQLDAEIESSDKYIREYDDSELQKAYNKGLRNALKALKGLVGEE